MMGRALHTSGLLALATLTLGGCPTRQRRPRLSMKLYWLGQDYYAKATKARDPGKRQNFLLEAFVNVKKAVKADQTNYRAQNLLGYLYLQKADQEQGLLEVAQCLQGPAAQESRHRVDELFHLAQTAFRRALAGHRVCTSARLGLVNVMLHFKEYEDAAKACQAIVEALTTGRVDPSCSNKADKAVALGNLGWAYYNLRRYVLAERSLRQALTLAPKFYLARYWLGRLLYERGRHKAALVELERTVKEFGLPQVAWRYYGLALAKLGRLEEARRALGRCVEFAPRSCAAQDCRRYLRLLAVRKGRPMGGYR